VLLSRSDLNLDTPIKSSSIAEIAGVHHLSWTLLSYDYWSCGWDCFFLFISYYFICTVHMSIGVVVSEASFLLCG
jgi:hypothetical protein